MARKKRRLTKKEFTAGFERKSFLGSAFPSVRAEAPRLKKVFGIKLGKSPKKRKTKKKVRRKG